MSGPIHVDIPHQLGKEGARARLSANAHKLARHVPGGMAEVTTGWEGDRMTITVAAMGQTVTAYADVREDVVHAEIMLPFLLSMFEAPIAAAIRSEGPKLLT
ncbi:polyhydroxyalkanoic acid system family protein [Sphingomonas quercus]|uniref:Polyhydroxyalkanoic acid system family protein n=1 Tax=Sphingomonas quercus TaxID=2842451 RepID=A0ABS6BHM4_9SPHN|nr:polyhydroxyalkanoic acid system family protein [Sphingomonas quercus]MBU3077798.1 polyhydroxyalkanoic acid system family protein [Sphingomonas quercus]